MAAHPDPDSSVDRDPAGVADVIDLEVRHIGRRSVPPASDARDVPFAASMGALAAELWIETMRNTLELGRIVARRAPGGSVARLMGDAAAGAAGALGAWAGTDLRPVSRFIERRAGQLISTVLSSLDLGEFVDALDVDSMLASVDLDAVLARIDVDALVRRIDVDALLSQVDVEALLDRIDIGVSER